MECIVHCYTELQVITKFIEKQLKKYELTYETDYATEDIAVIKCQNVQNTRIRIIQMQKIIKIFINSTDVHRIWFNHRSFIRPKLTNTFTTTNIIN